MLCTYIRGRGPVSRGLRTLGDMERSSHGQTLSGLLGRLRCSIETKVVRVRVAETLDVNL